MISIYDSPERQAYEARIDQAKKDFQDACFGFCPPTDSKEIGNDGTRLWISPQGLLVYFEFISFNQTIMGVFEKI